MAKRWTRRKFLETGLAGSIVVGGRRATGSATLTDHTVLAGDAFSLAFTPREREILRVAMDEIIPATDGMPSASEVGGVEYLDQLAARNQDIGNQLRASVAALERLSGVRINKSFLSLSRAERVEVLKALEQRDGAGAFATLRDSVYECYYTQPKVWTLLGYKFNPTNESGPPMKPFDERILAQVRKKPKYYREVP